MSATVKGGKELARRLDALSRKTRGRILESAARAGAEPIRSDAAGRAPKRTGQLGDEMIIEVKKRASTEVTVGVGPSKDAFYGKFQEFGTRNHAAQPFLRPAFDAHKDDAVRELGDVLRREILKVARG